MSFSNNPGIGASGVRVAGMVEARAVVEETTSTATELESVYYLDQYCFKELKNIPICLVDAEDSVSLNAYPVVQRIKRPLLLS